jgi:ABC-type transport system substrate-binding protein
VSRPRRRTAGSAASTLALAVLLAACGPTIPPIPTSAPTDSPPPETPRPSEGAFVPTAYPPSADAPCNASQPPDATHAPYDGELKRIEAKDASTVVFELCAPDVAFLTKVASPAFGINDSGWLRSHVSPTGSGDQPIVGQLNGTGPYRLESWDRGAEISLARNEAYWGTAARNERLIVRWDGDPTRRVAELQAGTVDGVDDLDPAGVATVAGDVTLQAQPRAGRDVVYLGFSTASPPLGSEKVRQAIAGGIDRATIVSDDLPPGAEVATHYTPCEVPHGCAGGDWTDYDPVQARELLAAAGLPDGFTTTLYYSATPTSSMPDPGRVAAEVQTELLTNLGIRAELVLMPDEAFHREVDDGTLDGLHLLDRSGAYPDPSAYLDPRFGGGAGPEFGTPFPDVASALAAGRASVDPAKRDAAYAKANDLIRQHVPMIPIGRATQPTAYLADVDGAQPSPVGLEHFAAMTPGDRRQLVWLTTAEPPGLYCADETDPIAGLVCSQVMDGLYAFTPGGSTPIPDLATACDPNAALTVWTCHLRRKVLFDDGSTLDANDVVLSFAVQWDAEHPLHRGRTGAFATFAAWFGGFLDAPAAPAPAAPSSPLTSSAPSGVPGPPARPSGAPASPTPKPSG